MHFSYLYDDCTFLVYWGRLQLIDIYVNYPKFHIQLQAWINHLIFAEPWLILSIFFIIVNLENDLSILHDPDATDTGNVSNILDAVAYLGMLRSD